MAEPGETPEPAKNRLGKYHLIALLARGGMGNVYLASAQGNSGFNKLLVVKELKPEYVGDEMFLKMFTDEARLSARLAHPNIVQTFEVGEEQHFLVMEYLEGQPLTSLIKRLQNQGKKLELRPLLTILASVLEALDYAHKLKDFGGAPLHIVHRDVCPHNVYLTYDGRTKLLDFGIAKALQTETTRVGTYKGRVAYMPPEQLSGNVDARADVYAVGVVLWEGLAGRRMWQGKTETEITVGLTLGKIPSLREAAPDVDPQLLALVERATAPEKEARVASAGELLHEIEAYLTTVGGPLSPRELGRTLMNLFSEEAAKLHAVVEEHVARVRNAVAAGRSAPEIPSIREAVRRDSFASGSGPAVSLADLPPLIPAMTESPPPRALASTVPPPGKRRARRSLILVGIGVALGCGAAVFAASRTSSSRPERSALAAAESVAPPASSAVAPATPPSIDPSAPTAAPAAPPQVALTVNVTPKSASVFLDDAPVDGDPRVAQLAQDGATHVVRIEAPGFVAERREVKAVANEVLELALVPDRPSRGQPVRGWRQTYAPPTPPAITTATTPPATTATVPPATSGDTKQRPKRDIDRKDPYSK